MPGSTAPRPIRAPCIMWNTSFTSDLFSVFFIVCPQACFKTFRPFPFFFHYKNLFYHIYVCLSLKNNRLCTSPRNSICTKRQRGIRLRSKQIPRCSPFLMTKLSPQLIGSCYIFSTSQQQTAKEKFPPVPPIQINPSYLLSAAPFQKPYS